MFVCTIWHHYSFGCNVILSNITKNTHTNYRRCLVAAMTVAAAANVVSLDKNTTCGWVSAAPAVAKERNEHTFINFALFFSFLIHSFWLEAGAALFRKLILTHFEYFRRSCRHRRLCLCCGLHSTQKKDQKNSFWNYTILFYLHTCILIYIHFSRNINLVNLFAFYFVY